MGQVKFIIVKTSASYLYSYNINTNFLIYETHHMLITGLRGKAFDNIVLKSSLSIIAGGDSSKSLVDQMGQQGLEAQKGLWKSQPIGMFGNYMRYFENNMQQ